MRLLDYDRQFDVASLIRHYFKPSLVDLTSAASVGTICVISMRVRPPPQESRYARCRDGWDTPISTPRTRSTHVSNGSHDEDIDRLDATTQHDSSTGFRKLTALHSGPNASEDCRTSKVEWTR